MRVRLLPAFMLLALLAGLVPGSDQSVMFYTKGQQQVRNKEFLDAAIWFHCAAAAGKGALRTKSLVWIAYCYQQTGFNYQAIHYYKEALKHHPGYRFPRKSLASLQLVLGRSREAYGNLVRLAESGVRDARVFRDLAVAAVRLGNRETAFQALCSSWIHSTNPDLRKGRAPDFRTLRNSTPLGRILANGPVFRAAFRDRKRFVTLQMKRKFGKSVPALRSMVRHFRFLDNGKGPFSAWAEVRMGNHEENRGQYHAAGMHYSKAVTLFSQLRPVRKYEVAVNMKNIAETRLGLHRPAEAVSYLNTALRIYRTILPSASFRIGEALVLLGKANHSQGKNRLAVSNIRAALAVLVHHGAKHARDLAEAYDLLGTVARALREYKTAVSAFKAAEAVWRRIGPYVSYDLAWTLVQLGGVAQEAGDNKNAFLYMLQALPMYRQTLDEGNAQIGKLYIDLGMLSWSIGKYGEASMYLRQAIGFFTKYANPARLQEAWNQLGLIYQWSAHYDDSVSCYRKALAMRIPADKAHIDLAGIHDNLGNVLVQQGKVGEALPHFWKAYALRIVKKSKDPFSFATTCINLGIALMTKGDLKQAMEMMLRGGQIMEKRYARTDSRMGSYYTNLALVHMYLGNLKKAGELLRTIARMYRTNPIRDNQIIFQYNLAVFYHRTGQWKKALAEYDSAIDTLMDMRMRAGISKYELSRKFGYLYDYLIYLALEKNEPELAFRAANRRRGLTLAEGIDNHTALKSAGVSAGEFKAYSDMENRMARLYSGRDSILSLPDTPGRSSSLLRIEDDILSLKKQLSEITARLKKKYPRYGLVRTIRAPSAALLRQHLDKNEIIIDYLFHSKGLLAFVVTKKDGLRVFHLADPRGANGLAVMVHNLYNFIKAPSDFRQLYRVQLKRGYAYYVGREYVEEDKTGLVVRKKYRHFIHKKVEGVVLGPEIGQVQTRTLRKIHAILVAPILKEYPGIRRLVFIPNRYIHFLPFHMLENEKGEPLIAGMSVVRVPSTIIWERLRRRRNSGWSHPLLVMGNGVYHPGAAAAMRGKRRVRGSDIQELADLPGTAREIEEIIPLSYPGAGQDLLKQHILTGVRANEDELRKRDRSGMLATYRVIHFAVHGMYFEKDPNRNCLVFSRPYYMKKYRKRNLGEYLKHGSRLFEDGYLKLNEAGALQLKSQLVVLSACETSMGDYVAGEGVVGLPQAFLVAGSEGVLASLWPVDDLITGLFMRHFYQGLFKEKLRPEVALSRAQMAVRAEFPDPFYWAPFVYYGR